MSHSLKGTEVLEYSDPYSIGGIGHVGTPHGMKVVDNCDLLIISPSLALQKYYELSNRTIVPFVQNLGAPIRSEERGSTRATCCLTVT